MNKALTMSVATMAFVAGGSGIASALNSSNGGVSSWTSGTNDVTVNVKDLAADGFSVKIEYKRTDSSVKQTLTETRGKGYSRSSTAAARVSHIHGCVVRPALPVRLRRLGSLEPVLAG